ncbi:DNA gyrase subunit A [Candidatus Ichthyocystis hellenicum]|uniref:DNA gyrase subunit A n=1 Tax=Candidatus Ichthyocystis hellenicum TaxID=1561003 RepID=UPI000AADC7D2|nr:DNA gyrase subunit A [Candidatus Ichthyocystis hellenicum]
MKPFTQETISVSLEEEMKSSYMDYAMSVIVGRALPDVRDGLKPVHRRVMYAMNQLNNVWNKPHKKSARIVGDVIGKYHPHGDSAVYDTIVRMAQKFSLRYTLIDGQGNFGSVDGDNAAAMRYTEIRISRIGQELMVDIDSQTVDFGPNYDNSEIEPLVLPTRIPNLLVNGSSGIAVGMATNIPPHHISEVIDACLSYLDNPEISINDLIRIVPAPDFPTGGIIYGTQGVHDGYRTGRGRVIIRAKVHFEDLEKGNRHSIIIDELPYQVNKKNLLEKIADLVNNKKLEGISDIRDESDRDGMRVVLELKRGENPEIVTNNLYRLTSLQYSFGMNFVALVKGKPQVLNLKSIIQYFTEHRREVVTRRTIFDLKKARERGHLLEGLAVALSNINEIIALIKSSSSRQEAHEALMKKAWPSSLIEKMLGKIDEKLIRPDELRNSCGIRKDGYLLSDPQAKAILDMQLSKLTSLEQDKIFRDYKNIVDTICDLLDVLDKPERVNHIIREELYNTKKEFGDKRMSQIVTTTQDFCAEDLIPAQDMMITLSHAGYIKAQPLSDYRSQKRGGKGKIAAKTREQDFIEHVFTSNTHDYILCFSTRGRCYWVKVHEIPQGSRISRGRPIVNIFQLQEGEKITAILSVKEFTEDNFVFMATSMGTVKKTSLSEFNSPRRSGLIAINLDDGDHLIGVAITEGNSDVMLFSDVGKAVRFSEQDVRKMGRTARGVRGITLGPDQKVITMLVTEKEENIAVLAATENGFGKRTLIEEYPRHGRGTKGVIAIQQSKRNGRVVSAALVSPDDEVMLITLSGVLIRLCVNGIREVGRSAQGVNLINLSGKDTLVKVQKIVESEDDSSDEE